MPNTMDVLGTYEVVIDDDGELARFKRTGRYHRAAVEDEGADDASSATAPSAPALGHAAPRSLADILERVLDKGIVIAGDIQINLLDIELLTIKLRLLVASVDKAKEMGINWWESDPALSQQGAERAGGGEPRPARRLERLERLLPEGEKAAL